MKSYRRYRDNFFNEKKNWKKEYLKRHKPDINHYYCLRNPGNEKLNYMTLYKRCIYCGYSLELLPTSSVHIDHFNAQANCVDNSIDNLVCSCFSCNSRKKRYTFPDNIHPDKNDLEKFLYRNEYFEIKPIEVDNDISLNIITNLGLDRRFHKIRYLLEEIDILLIGLAHSSTTSRLRAVREELLKLANRDYE